jgi:hypothetical protein
MQRVIASQRPEAHYRVHVHDHVHLHVQVDAVRTFTA